VCFELPNIRLDSECMIVSSDARMEQYPTCRRCSVQLTCMHQAVCNNYNQFSAIKQKGIVSSLENNHLIFRLAYLVDIFQ